jgi:hypothetical protein
VDKQFCGQTDSVSERTFFAGLNRNIRATINRSATTYGVRISISDRLRSWYLEKPGQTEMTLKGTGRSKAKRRASFRVISVCFTFSRPSTFPFDRSFSWQPATLVSIRSPQEAL